LQVVCQYSESKTQFNMRVYNEINAGRGAQQRRGAS
jgi:hypothetical protein